MAKKWIRNAYLRVSTAVKLTAPEELKGQFEAKLAEVAEFYKKRRDNGRMDFWLL